MSQETALEGEGSHQRKESPRKACAARFLSGACHAFYKTKKHSLALAQGVLGQQEGGIGPGEVWWPFQLVPQAVCKQAPEASGNSFPISNRENRFTGLHVWEEHHSCWDVNPENTGRDL